MIVLTANDLLSPEQSRLSTELGKELMRVLATFSKQHQVCALAETIAVVGLVGTTMDVHANSATQEGGPESVHQVRYVWGQYLDQVIDRTSPIDAAVNARKLNWLLGCPIAKET